MAKEGGACLKIRITPGAVLLLSVMALSRNELFFATLLCVAVHECGHLFAAHVLDVRIRTLELDIGGAQLITAGLFPSYRAEWLVAAAGPAASFLLALVFLPVSGDFARSTLQTSISLALFNLLPVRGFDGGRMLHAASAPLLGEGVATRMCAIATYLVLLFLFSLASCLLLRHGENLTLLVLCASLFAKLFLFAKGV